MAEEPTLPLLPCPAVSWDEHSQSFSNNPRKRVRNPRSSGLLNSSDPAVFSSDDDPGLDNYVEGRKKKRYIGSWFQQQPTSSDSTFSECHTLPRPSGRKMCRQFDSGVFLGSDGTDGEDNLAADVLERPLQPKLPQLNRPQSRAVSKVELLAREKVLRCLELDDESIDFWAMGLEELSNETISPLSNFSCIPLVTKDVAFKQKEPELKIYLAMNRLRVIPGALCDLEHLTILSLRGNKLTEIPPAISKLSNLKQLNVSQNRLRSIPAELLDLFQSRLRELVLHPNPFFEPACSLDLDRASLAHDDHDDVKENQLLTRYLGRSPLQVANSVRQTISDFRFPPFHKTNILPVASENEASRSDEANPTRPSRVPTLVEIALRSCHSTTQLPDLHHYIPEGLSHLRELLEQITQQKKMGGITCSHCRKLIMVPTLEWIEWREISKCEKSNSGAISVRPLSLVDGERAVPFLHRGCSWKCKPV